ncbi:MAG: MarR family transcriptional regulator [Herminiimonas sp.]|uniref:MarR family winged helix-turn-helix transcriptional regulator n=1 Tax=Herminiimonas sp. TaxID=1926289 RepID=UPI00271F2ED3|nr:MarR family transcriptional regulator [Herminiimonas sp.]MDO9421161.1 MarR family transcriptional regulator [Herminiimonas sp.]
MFDHCLYFNTTALARVLEREWSKAFKPFGLTPSQAFMLRAVLKKPGMLQSELAKELAISRSTATRSLDGLQQLGLLLRLATGNDGRESAIQATAAGIALQEQLDTASGEVTKRLKKELGLAHFDETVTKVKQVRSTIA